MEKLIDTVLEQHRDVNLHSAAGRQTIVKAMMKKIRSKEGWFLNLNTIDGGIPEVGDEEERAKWICEYCSQSTFEVEYDYIGSNYNHLSCELKEQYEDVQKQIYKEITAEGLPPGGDTQAVLESRKLAEEIVDNKEEKYIFESPDGGKTVYKRKFNESKKTLVSDEEWQKLTK